VHLDAVVESATTCRFTSARTLKGLPSIGSCASGRASVTIRLPHSAPHEPQTYAFYLIARGTGATSTTRRAVVVVGTVAPSPKQPKPGASTDFAPRITTEPASESVAADALGEFTAAASGAPTPSVQWQVSTDGGSTWGTVAGATYTTHEFVTSAAENGYEYRAVFTNTAGSATTTAATLTVTSAPVVTMAPADQTVVSGGTATFSAAASGYPVATVVWQYSTDGGGSWTDAAEATSTSYAFTVQPSETGYEYRAVFTNAVGSATTGAAALTVTSPPVVTQQPGSEGLPSGHFFILFAAASGNPTPSVQWQITSDGGGTWADISGATSTSYSSYAHALGSGTEYRAVFTNAIGSATTSAAVLTVNPAISYNWSGYVAIGATFTSVIGHWIVPTLTCPASGTYVSSQWVGIDGYTDPGAVEQDGTEADCSTGSATYHAWYEMLGDTALNGGAQVPLSSTSYPVSPGDEITATLDIANSNWTFEITDVTKWSFESLPIAAYTPAPARSSAEWIVECTSGCASPLADFGTVHFAAATADGDGHIAAISSFAFTALEMLNESSVPIAIPSPLDSIGEGFTDTWSAG